jgi:hypothetical protein
MRKPKVKFSLMTIADALKRSDLESARAGLSFAIGANVEICGRVAKVVRRDGRHKLIIDAVADSDLTVFADFSRARKEKLRKGSAVLICGKFQTFGLTAVCLSECKLQTGEKMIGGAVF